MNRDQRNSGIAVTKVITIEDPMKARNLSLGFFNDKGGKKVRYLFRRQGARSRSYIVKCSILPHFLAEQSVRKEIEALQARTIERSSPNRRFDRALFSRPYLG
jgi:hypothetical protein